MLTCNLYRNILIVADDDFHVASAKISKLLFGTIPSFDLTKVAGVSKECRLQSAVYQRELKKFSLWALKSESFNFLSEPRSFKTCVTRPFNMKYLQYRLTISIMNIRVTRDLLREKRKMLFTYNYTNSFLFINLKVFIIFK